VSESCGFPHNTAVLRVGAGGRCRGAARPPARPCAPWALGLDCDARGRGDGKGSAPPRPATPVCRPPCCVAAPVSRLPPALGLDCDARGSRGMERGPGLGAVTRVTEGKGVRLFYWVIIQLGPRNKYLGTRGFLGCA
jgi:hypothetical protein